MSDSTYNVAVFGATSSIASETMRAIAGERTAHFRLFGRNADRLAAVASDLEARGASSETCEVDLLASDVDWAAELEGKDWDLIYIAHGSLPDQEATLADAGKLELEMAINFVSPVLIASACVPVLERQESGTLAIIGSVAGDRGRQSNFLYGAAKSGLETFADGLRHRLFHLPDVKVTLLKPGMTDTPMTAGMEKGPLFSSATKVGGDAWTAIKKGRSSAYLPGWWWMVMTIIRLVPAPVFYRTKL